MAKKTLRKFKFMGYPVQTYKLGKRTYEFVVGYKSGYSQVKVANVRAKNLIVAKKLLRNWMRKGGHHKGGISRRAFI